MSYYNEGWCHIEGLQISNKEETYNNSLVNIPANKPIFYVTTDGGPEIQLNNKTSAIYGVVYKIVPVKDILSSCIDIETIDNNYISLMSAIGSYSRVIDLHDSTNAAQYYFEPIVIMESSVIFYASTQANSFDHTTLVLVDETITPKMIAISAVYEGGSVPIDTKLDKNKLVVQGIYEDGKKAKIMTGYTITDPSDLIITKVNSNPVTIEYVTPDGTVLKTIIFIIGSKRLIDVTAMYDGPSISNGMPVDKKYIIVTAHFSDGTSNTVTDYTFKNGTIPDSSNNILIYYKGFDVTLTIPTYDVSGAQLIAYYNGPPVEINHDFDISYVNVKIHYFGSNSINNYYIDILPEDCNFSTTTIISEGSNKIVVQYDSDIGLISTVLLVIGIKPEVVPVALEAVYNGPDIYIGKSFSPERLIVKVHYSNGSCVVTRQFSLQSNVVTLIGPNEFVVTYKEKDTTVTTIVAVIGLENDSTTDTNFNPITLDNNYPEATMLNNRYRGPAESKKIDNIQMMLYNNINEINRIYTNIEKEFNKLIALTNTENTIKYKTLNDVNNIEKSVQYWKFHKDFTTGKYKPEGENNE